MRKADPPARFGRGALLWVLATLALSAVALRARSLWPLGAGLIVLWAITVLVRDAPGWLDGLRAGVPAWAELLLVLLVVAAIALGLSILTGNAPQWYRERRHAQQVEQCARTRPRDFCERHYRQREQPPAPEPARVPVRPLWEP